MSARGRRNQKVKEEWKNSAEESENFLNDDFIPLGDSIELDDHKINEDDTNAGEFVRDNRSSFFGLLDRQELEYFKNAESILATNSLNNDEQDVFIENLFAEANGKELKLATNQICSKLLERMINLANTDQLMQIVRAFEPFCIDISFQRFSSHCLEAVINKGATVPECSELICSISDKLTKNSNDMLTDPYAPHVLCTLMLSLTGMKNDVRSKKSKLARKHTEIDSTAMTTGQTIIRKNAKPLKTSSEFQSKAKKLVKSLSKGLSKVDARKLAIDPVGTTVIQTILKVDYALCVNSGKKSKNTLLNTIFDESDCSGFVTHCISDPVGVHFLETAVNVMSSKFVSKFVRSLPIEKLANNDDLAPKYLIQTLLLRSNLPEAQKQEMVENYLLPYIASNTPIAIAALQLNFEKAAESLTVEFEKGNIDLHETGKTAIFEKLTKYPPFTERAIDYIIKLDDKDMKQMCIDPTLSYVIQGFLDPKISIISRRKLINKMFAILPALVVNANGSHIVDSLWVACYKLKFARERIANELTQIEADVKHSPYGRKVWKNWQLEKYAHARHLWWEEVKKLEDSLRSKIEPGTPIQRNMPPASNSKQKKRKISKP